VELGLKPVVGRPISTHGGSRMSSTIVFCRSIVTRLDTGPDMCDITPDLAKTITDSKIENGNLSATVVGSTGL